MAFTRRGTLLFRLRGRGTSAGRLIAELATREVHTFTSGFDGWALGTASQVVEEPPYLDQKLASRRERHVAAGEWEGVRRDTTIASANRNAFSAFCLQFCFCPTFIRLGLPSALCAVGAAAPD